MKIKRYFKEYTSDRKNKIQVWSEQGMGRRYIL